MPDLTFEQLLAVMAVALSPVAALVVGLVGSYTQRRTTAQQLAAQERRDRAAGAEQHRQAQLDLLVAYLAAVTHQIDELILLRNVSERDGSTDDSLVRSMFAAMSAAGVAFEHATVVISSEDLLRKLSDVEEARLNLRAQSPLPERQSLNQALTELRALARKELSPSAHAAADNR